MRRPRYMVRGLGLLPLAWVLAACSEDTGGRGSGPGGGGYDLQALRKVDPRLIGYREEAAIDAGLEKVHGIAVGPGGRIYVSGRGAVRIFAKDGALASEFKVGGEAKCIAVAPAGTIYVGIERDAGENVEDRVEVFDKKGQPVAAWKGLGPDGIVTSIAATNEHVFVADAGKRLVHQYDPSGRAIRRIGTKGEGSEGFHIPSPYFDVAVEPGVLWVANTGLWRLEAYSFDGCLGSSWGKGSTRIDGFCGCCNPAHFAVAADGSFVTSEKGLLRVKLHDSEGKFVCVVAAPASFSEEVAALDVAVDPAGRVLVLDPVQRRVRVFVRREKG